MASSASEDQDQRSNAGLEDLTTMTIESLRARLLSERAISKSSRQRADELAKRVLELEEQLKMVSLQRKKAEKATADVLAILESNGISDASDAYESNSDQETISDSKVSDDNMKRKETSSNFEVRKSDTEAYSSSEIDSSTSTGRSLSWKSSKDSLHSLQRTKNMEAVRRRSSTFTSNGSSLPKRVGKSCRRIRRRESRSATEQLQDNANMHDSQGNKADAFSKNSPTCADIEHPANHVVNDAAGTPVSGMQGNRGANAFYPNRNGQNEDIDGTLQHQAQFIGQFEAEEKAQREWEEKVRENSSSLLDSCDPGNRSDVTEERDYMKASGQLNPEGRNTQNLGSKLEVGKPSFSEEELELKVANNMVIPSNIDDTYLQDQKTSSIVASGSSSKEFTSSTSKGNQSQSFSGNLEKTPPQSSHMSSISNGSPGIPSAHGPSFSAKDGESSETKKELALIPQKSSNNLESVLEALQQARLSLNQKLRVTPLSEIGSSARGTELSVPGIRTGERMEIPVGCPGLFRLPTDFPSVATAKVNYLGSNSASILASGYHEPSTERFLGRSYEERRSSALLGNQLYASPATPLTEIRSEVHRPAQAPPFPQGISGLHASAMPFREIGPGISASRAVYENAFDTGLSSSSGSSYFDPQMNPGLVSGLHASAMPSTEIQPSIPATRPAYKSAFSTGLSSSDRSSYLDNQTNPWLVLPSRYTYPTYPFHPEVAQRVPTNDKLSSNVPSMQYGMTSASRFSLYDDHIRPNMYK